MGYSPYGYDAEEKQRQRQAESEKLVFGLVEILKVRGDARAVALLINSRVEVLRECYDNWNGGLYNVSIRIQMDFQTYALLQEEELEALKVTIQEVGTPVLVLDENDSFEGVQIQPSEDPKPGWREAAKAWVRGDGVNNQGRVRSDNIAAREHDGLLFRSEAEVNLHNALKRHGVTFAPLPVFIRGGRSYSRLEPDFLVIKDGFVLQVEVDGDTYHKESPVDAQARVAPMEHEGVQVRRFKASEVETPEQANKAVERLLQWIRKQRQNR